MADDRKDEVIENLILELRRGTVVISVLSKFSQPEYGYNLIEKLHENGLEVDAGTLYPLLRRLEKQKLLISSWDTTQTRARKYYVISDYGVSVLKQLINEWNNISKGMDLFLAEGEKK